MKRPIDIKTSTKIKIDEEMSVKLTYVITRVDHLPTPTDLPSSRRVKIANYMYFRSIVFAFRLFFR